MRDRGIAKIGFLLVVIAVRVLWAGAAHAAAFTVNVSDDDNNGSCDGSHCSLREAIDAANASAGSDQISFAIPGGSVHTISPATALPVITGPVTIDGYTQPGASPNTLVAGDDAVILIELDGAAVGGTDNGLFLTGGNSTVRGLAINGFGGDGIRLAGGGHNTIAGNFLGTDATGLVSRGNDDGIVIDDSADNVIGGTTPATRNLLSGNVDDGVDIRGDAAIGNVVAGNFIGTDATGAQALGNADEGVQVRSPSNTIGGTAVGARNVISGNVHEGIHLETVAATANLVAGNFIGLDATGVVVVGNGANGVLIDGGSNNVVGGTDAAARNVISGNFDNGISIVDASNNVVQGNYLGTDVTGTLDRGNFSGVKVGPNVPTTLDNRIGGASTGAGNVISGNEVGVFLLGASRTIVEGNFIGTDAAGTSALGNDVGIDLIGVANRIGGATAGAANVISGNGGDGVDLSILSTDNLVQGNFIGTDLSGAQALGNGGSGVVSHAASALIGGIGSGNTIAFNAGDGVEVPEGSGSAVVGNRIFANALLGIDLGSDGATANDIDDADVGSNGFQNFPALTSATDTGSATAIAGSLNSTAQTRFTLDFFASTTCDPSGFGEGQTYLGSTVVTLPGSKNVTFTALVGAAPAGQTNVTTTATDQDGNTSEFSPCTALVSGNAPPLGTPHDLAVVATTAPRRVTLNAKAPTKTAKVQVTIQNRSPHTETIVDAAVLADLVYLNLHSLGACAAPTPTLVPPAAKKFPLALKSKKKLKVTFAVTFSCANDPAKTRRAAAHDDYRHTATVNHAALDGIPDTHAVDDVCPRAALNEPNPDGKIKDKGCGKKAQGALGPELLTDVVVK